MNQILQTRLNNKKVKYKKILRFQLFLSVILLFFTSCYLIYNLIISYRQEKYSKRILDSYNITKLYSNSSLSNSDFSNKNLNVIGIIEIQKIGVNYPVFSNYDDNLLKISPCRFYGPLPGKIGNLCIAGHNYDNDKFFSRISSLDINDEIIIYTDDNSFSYFVYKIYEVKSNDISPIYSYNSDSRELTLITCNNFNNNRFVVKAVCK